MENNLAIIAIVAGVLVTGAIVFLALYFSKKAVVRRKLKKAPARKIMNFVNGETARITGRVELTGEPLTAPLSGRRCAYFHVLVEQQVSTGKGAHWQKYIEEEVAGRFGIRDGKHCATIDCSQVKSYIVGDRKYSSGFMHDAEENLRRYLARHSKGSTNVLGWNKTLRYREGIIEEGETIAVLGKGEWVRADQGQWSDDYGKVLMIRPSKGTPVYLTDDPSVCRET